jgi:hypothetical protein
MGGGLQQLRYRYVEATTCIWREREDTVVTGSMRRRSDITCIHGMERQQAKMSIALGGEIEYGWGFEGSDMAPRFLQTLHCALAATVFQSLQFASEQAISPPPSGTQPSVAPSPDSSMSFALWIVSRLRIF